MSREFDYLLPEKAAPWTMLAEVGDDFSSKFYHVFPVHHTNELKPGSPTHITTDSKVSPSTSKLSPSTITCPLCRKKFKSSSTLANHKCKGKKDSPSPKQMNTTYLRLKQMSKHELKAGNTLLAAKYLLQAGNELCQLGNSNLAFSYITEASIILETCCSDEKSTKAHVNATVLLFKCYLRCARIHRPYSEEISIHFYLQSLFLIINRDIFQELLQISTDSTITQCFDFALNNCFHALESFPPQFLPENKHKPGVPDIYLLLKALTTELATLLNFIQTEQEKAYSISIFALIMNSLMKTNRDEEIFTELNRFVIASNSDVSVYLSRMYVMRYVFQRISEQTSQISVFSENDILELYLDCCSQCVIYRDIAQLKKLQLLEPPLSANENEAAYKLNSCLKYKKEILLAVISCDGESLMTLQDSIYQLTLATESDDRKACYSKLQSLWKSSVEQIFS